MIWPGENPSFRTVARGCFRENRAALPKPELGTGRSQICTAAFSDAPLNESVADICCTGKSVADIYLSRVTRWGHLKKLRGLGHLKKLWRGRNAGGMCRRRERSTCATPDGAAEHRAGSDPKHISHHTTTDSRRSARQDRRIRQSLGERSLSKPRSDCLRKNFSRVHEG